jgi:membrane protein required for colicin V production
MSMLPDDPESTILKRLKRPKPGEDPEAPDQQRGANAPAKDDPGYRQADRAGMQGLIQSKVR